MKTKVYVIAYSIGEYEDTYHAPLYFVDDEEGAKHLVKALSDEENRLYTLALDDLYDDPNIVQRYLNVHDDLSDAHIWYDISDGNYGKNTFAPNLTDRGTTGASFYYYEVEQYED